MKASILTLGIFLGLMLPAGRAAAFDPFSRELENVAKGNRLYKDQHYQKAIEAYDAAEHEVSGEPRVHFNRGNALFKLGSSKEAREAYLRAMGFKKPGLKKRNYYNIGNTFLAQKAYRDAVSYYRRALEIDSGYDDARYNLEIAIRAIEQQKQQQKNDKDKKNKQGDKSQKQKQNEKDKQKKGDQKKNEHKQDGDKKDDDKKDSQEKQDKQQQQKQQQKQQQDQKGQKEKNDGDKQEKQEQAKQDEKKAQQQQQQQQQEAQKQPAGTPPPDERREAGKLTHEQAQALLDAMRDNEKPFQMYKFVMPKYRGKKVDKDW